MQKESYKINNINVWQLFPISIVTVNAFSWLDFKIYYDFLNFIYRSIIQTVFH
jgi:hypothetical protein